MNKPILVVLTGAGISAESGIPTFRDAGGLWEGHDVYEVASPKGWAKNPALVLDFYNQRRANIKSVEPNAAHYALAALEKHYEVIIITQNVDDLHERAGSTSIVHLHGELLKVRSSKKPELVYEWHTDLNVGDVGADGAQLRPHIVWFGEDVPLIYKAAELCEIADCFAIIGTSMQVTPAASLIECVPAGVPTYYIDANPAKVSHKGLTVIAEKATVGVSRWMSEYLKIPV
jgi:NAD-dependent deacetylase